MDDTDADTPDLTGAEVFVEADERPTAGGRWLVFPNPAGVTDPERVLYQRPTGEYVHRPILTASTLRNSPSWRPLAPETAAAG